MHVNTLFHTQTHMNIYQDNSFSVHLQLSPILTCWTCSKILLDSSLGQHMCFYQANVSWTTWWVQPEVSLGPSKPEWMAGRISQPAVWLESQPLFHFWHKIEPGSAYRPLGTFFELYKALCTLFGLLFIITANTMNLWSKQYHQCYPFLLSCRWMKSKNVETTLSER